MDLGIQFCWIRIKWLHYSPLLPYRPTRFSTYYPSVFLPSGSYRFPAKYGVKGGCDKGWIRQFLTWSFGVDSKPPSLDFHSRLPIHQCTSSFTPCIHSWNIGIEARSDRTRPWYLVIRKFDISGHYSRFDILNKPLNLE